MQSKLETVLSEKEGELKLYQRFLNLKTFCEQHIFPSATVPLQRHIEAVKSLAEQLVPDPLTRTQEMFSGEVFVMLCLLYLHDVGVVNSYNWHGNDEIFDRFEKATKTFLINRDIGTLLDIPQSAIEIVNSLISYTTVRRISTEWEIREDSRRAIVRNTRALERVFSFAHLLWDVFSPDSDHVSLRRFEHPNLRLRCGVTSISVDSREGILFIKCLPEVPYQTHLLEMVKGYVEGAFKKFKEGLNGKLGFQYKAIVWETADISAEGLDLDRDSGLSPFYPTHNVLDQLEQATAILDTVFKNGHVIVTGPAGCGKTALVESFVLPQLEKISRNVFRSEVWESPVRDLRESISRATGEQQGSSDLVSVCNKLRQGGPCFFVLDCCERLQHAEEGETEKLKRFVDFCSSNENLYLIILGDKEDFFDWYRPFSRINLSAIFMMEPREGAKEQAQEVPVVSAEALKEIIDDVLKRSGNKRDLREVVAALLGETPVRLARCTVADIRSETGIPLISIVDYLAVLKEKGIVKEHYSFDSIYYTLSSRHLVEPLRDYLKLSEFDEKRRMRAVIGRAMREGAWLSPETLDIAERWVEKLVFDGEEMALVLASAVHDGRSPDLFLQRFEKDARSVLNIRSHFIVKLLNEADPEKRKAAVRLLARIRDYHMVNELLLHLRREDDYTVKGLILETLIGTGKKKTLVALMRTLSDISDKSWKLQAIDLLAKNDPSVARDGLLLLAETEKDPQILDTIERRFAMLEESL